MAKKKIERMSLQDIPPIQNRKATELIALVDDKEIVDDLLTSCEVQELLQIDGTVLVDYVRKGLPRHSITAHKNPNFVVCSFYRLSDIRKFLDKRKEIWDARMQEMALRYD